MPPFAATANLDATKPEVIVSAALYLMSSYGCNGGCPRLANVIVKHLRILAGRDDLPPVLCSTCASLAEQWEIKLHAMLPAAMPPAQAPSAQALLAASPPPSNVFHFKRSLH